MATTVRTGLPPAHPSGNSPSAPAGVRECVERLAQDQRGLERGMRCCACGRSERISGEISTDEVKRCPIARDCWAAHCRQDHVRRHVRSWRKLTLHPRSMRCSTYQILFRTEGSRFASRHSADRESPIHLNSIYDKNILSLTL